MATPAAPSPFDSLIDRLEANILTPLITLIGILAFLLFVYGVVEFIRNAENPEKRSTGQQHIIWGIVGFLIIFGASAIINLLKAFVGA